MRVTPQPQGYFPVLGGRSVVRVGNDEADHATCYDASLAAILSVITQFCLTTNPLEMFALYEFLDVDVDVDVDLEQATTAQDVLDLESAMLLAQFPGLAEAAIPMRYLACSRDAVDLRDRRLAWIDEVATHVGWDHATVVRPGGEKFAKVRVEARGG